MMLCRTTSLNLIGLINSWIVFMFTIFRCVELLDPDRLNRKKILMGLNFYGFDYTSQGGGHVLGRDLIKVCI